MTAVKWIAIWGLIAIASSGLAAIVAGVKNRDHSTWAAWTFIFPPLLIVLVLLPKNPGPRPRRPSMDEDDMTAH